MGKSQSSHGLGGAIVVDLINPHSDVWKKGKTIQIRTTDQCIESFIVETKGKVSNRIILKIDKIDHIDLLKGLLPCEVWLKREEFSPLAEDEIYLQDLKDFQVKDEIGNTLGRVKGFQEGHQMSMLLLDDAQETLIPFVKSWVRSIDEDKREITIFSFIEY